MIVFVNGSFVPEEQATISVFDRGWLYGDGLFETILIRGGRPFRWADHLRRMREGAGLLRIELPPGDLRGILAELVRGNQCEDGVARITLTRGRGLRGYSPRGADTPSLTMSLHPAPATRSPAHSWNVILASTRVWSGDPLLRCKTCNKLPQILARAEADAAGADEAIFANEAGYLTEGASCNLFWIKAGRLWTAPVGTGILPGITRNVIMELALSMGLDCYEKAIHLEEASHVDGMFLTLTSQGIAAVASFNGTPLPESGITTQLETAYSQLLMSKTDADALDWSDCD